MFEVAEAYERQMGRWSRQLAPLFVEFVGVQGDVLNVGCGTGALTFAISARKAKKMKQRKKHREQDAIIKALATEAIRCGADMIEVEYDEGYEEVYVRKDNVVFSIDGFEASSSQGVLLQKELYGLVKKKQRIAVDNVEYELRARVYDSFGVDAFQVQLRRV